MSRHLPRPTNDPERRRSDPEPEVPPDRLPVLARRDASPEDARRLLPVHRPADGRIGGARSFFEVSRGAGAKSEEVEGGRSVRVLEGDVGEEVPDSGEAREGAGELGLGTGFVEEGRRAEERGGLVVDEGGEERVVARVLGKGRGRRVSINRSRSGAKPLRGRGGGVLDGKFALRAGCLARRGGGRLEEEATPNLRTLLLVRHYRLRSGPEEATRGHPSRARDRPVGSSPNDRPVGSQIHALDADGVKLPRVGARRLLRVGAVLSVVLRVVVRDFDDVEEGDVAGEVGSPGNGDGECAGSRRGREVSLLAKDGSA